MSGYTLTAYAQFKEIDLNTIAAHFGIRKEFRWEDFLRLQDDQLSGIVPEPAGRQVHLFPYGSVVFINMSPEEMQEVTAYLQKIDPKLQTAAGAYTDDYCLQPAVDEESVTNDAMLTAEIKRHHLEIISTVLAKSVALESVEADIEVLLDDVEVLIDRLESGNLGSRDKTLAQTSARVLNFKYKTLSTIMLLDKPDITWDNEEASSLHLEMAHLFELGDRYERLQAKARTLMDILEVFSTLTQHRKANNLEWMIIALIVISISISLFHFIPSLF